MKETNPFYITTPIYYVNDKPHIGHAYTTILADVLAQYHRLLGEPVHFLTGTDEHGQKVQRAAEKAGITPKQQADRTVVRFKELWERLEITHNDFIRTTEDRHKVVVQQLLQDLYDRDEIYRAEYDGWYCVTDERFFTEKELQEENCPECGRPVERISEANYFFKMGKYQDWLIDYIENHPHFIQPDYRRNETLGFLRKPLNDLCISRPKNRLAWGIELPFDKDFVTYVWFDALVNYISAIGYGSDTDNFNKWWPVNYHLIGKDILTTHTVYWPTMLQAMNIPMPQTIFAHGWWLSGDSKMSKTEGNVVDPMDYAEEFGVDPFRYFLIAEMTLGQDASFTEEAFVKRYNSDLANDLGNLASRVLKMVSSNCDGKIPVVPDDVLKQPDEQKLWATCHEAIHAMEEALNGMRLDQGVGKIMQVVRDTNKYLEVKQPWTQAKQDDLGPLHITLYTACEVLRVVGALLYPVMPQKMAALREALGLEDSGPQMEKLRTWGVLEGGTAVCPVALFPRISKKTKPAPAEPPKAEKETEPVEGVLVMDSIDYDDFAKIKLRTAKIVAAEKVEDADKLLKLEVFVGEERRQIVAGIALHYEPEQLIGKSVVIVANLKPATIRGVESQGMLLAATAGHNLKLVTVDGELSSGAEVK